jgi:hypothetical protein
MEAVKNVMAVIVILSLANMHPLVRELPVVVLRVYTD